MVLLCGTASLLASDLPVELVTRSGRASVTAAGDSLLPVISGDGRWVAFQSGADNLVTNDMNRSVVDVFVREVVTGATRLVSVNTNGTSANGASELAGISRDGRRVLFVSDATDLVAGDENEAADVFVRDWESGATFLVSANTNGVSGSMDSSGARMTPDGRFVVFESEANDLAARDNNQVSDVFLRDLANGTTQRISAPSPTTLIAGRAVGASYDGQVSDDGATVVFRSAALNLTPPVPAGGQSLTNELYFLRSPATTNRMVDVFGTVVASPRPRLTVPAYAMSADGRYVALLLASSSTNVVPTGVYRVDLDTGEYRLLTGDLRAALDTASVEFFSPTISADGRTVLFEVQDLLPNSSIWSGPVVYAWDEASGDQIRVSSGGWVRNAMGDVTESPIGALLGASRDGQFVAFLGGSTNDAANSTTSQVVVRNRATGEVRRVSRTNHGAPLDASDYPSVSFSDDGKRMVFQSASDGFVADDLNRSWDVFLYDWDSDALSLISAASPARMSTTAFGDVILGPRGVSGDGRYIAFLSLADGLADGHRSFVRDVYRADRTTGTIEWVSVGADGTGPAFSSSSAVISRDGRFVAFSSSAENLVPGDTNRLEDVFLRDLMEGTTVLVNRHPDGGFVSGAASSPAISPDGRWVAFVSASAGLVTNHAGNQPQVYLFDRMSHQVTLASVTVNGAMPTDRPSGQPVFDPESRWLLFESGSAGLVSPPLGSGRSVYARRLMDGALKRIATTGLVSLGSNVPGPTPVATFTADGRYAATLLAATVAAEWDLYLHEFESETTTRLFGPVTGAALADGAARVAYRTSGTSADGAFQVRVLDRATGLDRVVSAASDGTPGDGPCDPPLITPDGRWVIFASAASNLIDGDDNGLTGIFVKDIDANTMVHLGGHSLTVSPVLSADGRTLVFRSYSDDWVAGDYNQTSDLFVVTLPGPESGYRITGITRLSTGALRLVWVATAGRTYRVQASPNPAGPWQDSGLTVVLEGSQGSAEVTGISEGFRFFRLEER